VVIKFLDLFLYYLGYEVMNDMKCHSCGYKNKDDADVCNLCKTTLKGSPELPSDLAENVREKRRKEYRKNKKKKLEDTKSLKIIGLSFTIGLVLLIFLYLADLGYEVVLSLSGRSLALIIFKIGFLVCSTGVFFLSKEPFSCSGIYTFFVLFSLIRFGFPFMAALSKSSIIFSLVSLYFWFLKEFEGEWFRWPVFIIGFFILLLI
jgi:hypothetical protein